MVESPTLVGAPASRPGRNEALAGLFRRARLGAGARQTGHHVAFAPVAQDNGAGVGHLVQRWTARARVPRFAGLVNGAGSPGPHLGGGQISPHRGDALRLDECDAGRAGIMPAVTTVEPDAQVSPT